MLRTATTYAVVCGLVAVVTAALTAGGVGLSTPQGAPPARVEAAVVIALISGGVAGLVSGWRTAHALQRLQEATELICSGVYDQPLRLPLGGMEEIARDLDRLRLTLADTESRRRRLIGEVAHEMRTPLTIIDGYVEGMIDGIIPCTADELGHVTEEGRRLRRLVDDLSALSRAEEGRLELRPVILDLRGVVVTAADRLRPQVTDAGLQLEVLPGDDLLVVTVDQDRVSQVVRNLVGNAVRATPPGGRITIQLGRSGRWTWFAVKDTGEGIGPADLERIFERFYRVPGRRSTRGETGSGIGLTIARDIMRAHGGELVARSAGQSLGAEFIAWLPEAPPLARRGVSPEDPPQPRP